MNRLILILALCATLITTTASAGNMGHGVDSASLPNTGRVLEVINVTGYTYLHVEDKEKKKWIAGKTKEVKVGDVVHYSKGSTMRNFFSKTLNRTFPEIIFTGAVEVEKPTVKTQVTAANPGQQLDVIESLVINTMDSGGYTYIEAQQSDKTVWLAAPKTAVKKGDKIRYANDGAMMKNFYSKTLNREFTEILFIGEAQVIQ